MAPSAIQNTVSAVEAKLGGGKKKKSKAQAERTASPAPTTSTPPAPSSTVNHSEEDDESPYVKEIRKNIRNVNKKLTNASKTDSLIASHPDKTLDDLVAAKIINADQKAQVLKKPGLEAQLAQLHEQLAQYQKIDAEYRARIATEKAAVQKALTEKHEQELAEIKQQAEKEAAQRQHDNLLILSQFLHLAAARRAEGADSQLDENMALEGVLLNVYSGDENAVATMTKLVEGVEEPTRSTSGEELKTTFAQVKAAATSYGQPPVQQLESTHLSSEATESAEGNHAQSDPTITHAGLTEMGDI